MAQKNRQTEKISGITIGKKHFSLFADDFLLYLSDINTSIPVLIEIIKEFSRFSGYKMNEEKTELLVINNTTNVLNIFKLFKVKTQNIKCLGCYISSDKSQLYKDNFLPLIRKCKLDVERWSDLKINLMDRINLFKTMWLPKFFRLSLLLHPNLFLGSEFNIFFIHLVK